MCEVSLLSGLVTNKAESRPIDASSESPRATKKKRGPTDRLTNGPMDKQTHSYRDARTHLKIL